MGNSAAHALLTLGDTFIHFIPPPPIDITTGQSTDCSGHVVTRYAALNNFGDCYFILTDHYLFYLKAFYS